MYKLTLQKKELEEYERLVTMIFIIISSIEFLTFFVLSIISVLTSNLSYLGFIVILAILILLLLLKKSNIFLIKILTYNKKKKLKEKCVKDLYEMNNSLLQNTSDKDKLLCFLKEILEMETFVENCEDILDVFYDVSAKLLKKIAQSDDFKKFFLLSIASKCFKSDDKYILDNMFKFLRDESMNIKEKSGVDFRIFYKDLNEILKNGSMFYSSLTHGVHVKLSDYTIISILFSLFYSNNKDDILQTEFNLKSFIPILKEKNEKNESQILKEIKDGRICSKKSDEYEDYLKELLKI